MEPEISKEQHLHESIRHYKARHYNEALHSSEQAIKQDPNYFIAHYGKSLALYGLELYEEALASFEQVIKINPSYAPAYNGQGDALSKLGRYKEAVSAHIMATLKDPNNWRAYNGMARNYSELYQYEEAVYAYDQAIKLIKNNSKLSSKIYSEREKTKHLANIHRIKGMSFGIQRSMISWYEHLRGHYGEEIPEDEWEMMESSLMEGDVPIGYSRIDDDIGFSDASEMFSEEEWSESDDDWDERY